MREPVTKPYKVSVSVEIESTSPEAASEMALDALLDMLNDPSREIITEVEEIDD